MWITHNLEQAERLSDTVWFMAEGRLLETAETKTFFKEPKHEKAGRFYKGAGADMNDLSLLLTSIFVIIALFLSKSFKAGVEKDMIVATVRPSFSCLSSAMCCR